MPKAIYEDIQDDKSQSNFEEYDSPESEADEPV